MQKWADNIKAIQNELAIVTANNHYTGFGPSFAICSALALSSETVIFVELLIITGPDGLVDITRSIL